MVCERAKIIVGIQRAEKVSRNSGKRGVVFSVGRRKRLPYRDVTVCFTCEDSENGIYDLRKQGPYRVYRV